MLDPQYNMHIHFSVVTGYYTYPPTNRVWLFLGRKNTDQSWAPLLSAIAYITIYRGDSLLVLIHFKLGLGTSKGRLVTLGCGFYGDTSAGWYSNGHAHF